MYPAVYEAQAKEMERLRAENERLRKELELERQDVADLKHDMERMLETINQLENER